MIDPSNPLAELLQRDPRYHSDSYEFVFKALRYGQECLDMGKAAGRASGSEGLTADDPDEPFDDEPFSFESDAAPSQSEKHVTGQDLCEAIRQYALQQYGLMARCVLSHWGVHSTDDFGEIVFNLIDIGEMKKTDSDRREDFADVFDFNEALAASAVFAASRDDRESAD
ncbi:MAG: Minf_1886 family protein [Planctomycetota bacterium]